MRLQELFAELNKKGDADLYVIAATCLELVARNNNGNCSDDEFKIMTEEQFGTLVKKYGEADNQFSLDQIKQMYTIIHKFSITELEALIRQKDGGEEYPHQNYIKDQINKQPLKGE